jgi:hypothetical protein
MNNKLILLKNFRTNSYRNTFNIKSSKRYFSDKQQVSNPVMMMLKCTGIVVSKSTNNRRPETFMGDIQEVLKLAPNNVNAYFFSWSIACRAATALLCLLIL